MSQVVKLRSTIGTWLRLVEPVSHPQYPESQKKFSGSFLFDEDQFPQVKAAFFTLIKEQLEKTGKLDGLTEVDIHKKVEATFDVTLDGQQSPLSRPPKTFKKDGKDVPNPDFGKWAIKGKNPNRPNLFIATPTGYALYPEDDVAGIPKLFYDGGIYNVILEIYYAKAGTIASSLRAIYWAGEGTPRGGSGYAATADDFEVPQGVFTGKADDFDA
jgi:hypothetical protein